MNSADEPVDAQDIDELRQVCARYVDGELGESENAEFERRMMASPAVHTEVDALRGMRDLFAPERVAATPKSSEGFVARVLAETRRLPTGAELQAAEVQAAEIQAAELAAVADVRGRFEQSCRRLVVAAALLIAMGGLTFGGLLRGTDSGELDASPEEVRAEMERLDELITERLRADAAVDDSKRNR